MINSEQRIVLRANIFIVFQLKILKNFSLLIRLRNL